MISSVFFIKFTTYKVLKVICWISFFIIYEKKFLILTITNTLQQILIECNLLKKKLVKIKLYKSPHNLHIIKIYRGIKPSTCYLYDS